MNASVDLSFRAGALATGCDYKIKLDDPYLDLRPNKVLADDYLTVIGTRYGVPAGYSEGTSASTDFVSIKTIRLQPQSRSSNAFVGQCHIRATSYPPWLQ